MSGFTESVVEDAALVWLGAIGYAVLHGRDISPVGDTLTPNPSPDGRGAQRANFDANQVSRSPTLRSAALRG